MEICRKDFAPVTPKELEEAEVRNDPDKLARLFARACYCGQEETIKVMLRMDGDVVDPNGHVDRLVTWYLTPMTMATVDGGLSNVGKVVELLLQRRANPSRQCGLGWTPLHHAAKAGNIDLVKLLLKAGVSTTLCNNKGYTATDYAENGEFWSLFDYLRDYALKTNCMIRICCPKEDKSLFSPLSSELLELIFDQVTKGMSLERRERETNSQFDLREAVRHGRPEVIEEIIETEGGLDYNRCRYAPGITLYYSYLQWAILYLWFDKRQPELFTKVVDLLLEAGADPAFPSKDGTTAFHTALDYGIDPKVLEAMLRRLKSGDAWCINKKDDSGFTALSLANCHNCNGSQGPELVKLLLNARASATELHPRSNKTALDYAHERGETEVVEVLQQALCM